MVLTDFLTETRRRWLKAFKLFKRNKNRKSTRNRISPALPASPSSPAPPRSGTVDARADIDLQQFCACRAPLSLPCDERSYYSYDSYTSSRVNSFESYADTRSDSAYDSARSSPHRVCYATVTYFNVNDSEDSSSILTEYTLLDEEMERDDDEAAQNIINESIELVSSL